VTARREELVDALRDDALHMGGTYLKDFDWSLRVRALIAFKKRWRDDPLKLTDDRREQQAGEHAVAKSARQFAAGR